MITEERRLERAQIRQLMIERIEQKLENIKLAAEQAEQVGTHRRRNRQRAGRQVRERAERQEAERMIPLGIRDGSTDEEVMEKMELIGDTLVRNKSEISSTT